MLKIYVYGGENPQPVIKLCAETVKELGHKLTPSLSEADLAIAPLLTEILDLDDIITPRIGTLVFHPSLLPRHKGRDAIKWAFHAKETYTGVTWFWPDEGIDTGDICEQEVLAVEEGETPRAFYERAVVPAAVRTLRIALSYIDWGFIRRVPQIWENGTWEPRFSRH